LAESDRQGRSAPELWGPHGQVSRSFAFLQAVSHGLEEGKGKGYLASSRQYDNALLGVRHQEEEVVYDISMTLPSVIVVINVDDIKT